MNVLRRIGMEEGDVKIVKEDVERKIGSKNKRIMEVRNNMSGERRNERIVDDENW